LHSKGSTVGLGKGTSTFGAFYATGSSAVRRQMGRTLLVYVAWNGTYTFSQLLSIERPATVTWCSRVLGRKITARSKARHKERT
jgi:hypothetical protein